MKPEITKEQAEAIEEGIKVYIRQGLRPGQETYNHFLIDHTKVFTAVTDPWKDLFSCLNDMDIATLAAALINGYEIVKSPEEELHEYYVEALHTARDETTGHDIQDAIRYTLETLDIKIEGVNA
ncbi:hypothetical protein ABEX06_00510 [Bacillus safensis]